jgi:hypothetical protein
MEILAGPNLVLNLHTEYISLDGRVFMDASRNHIFYCEAMT